MKQAWVVWQVARQVEGDNLSPLIELVTTNKQRAEQFVQDNQIKDRFVNIGGHQYAVVQRAIIEVDLDDSEE